MSQQSLGLIETIGLVAAIEAADAALKSANVQLVGYEFAKGEGMTVVKLLGEVGAVKAAVSAGALAASRVNRVVATDVIARPADGVSGVIDSPETVGQVTVNPVAVERSSEALEVIAREAEAAVQEAETQGVSDALDAAVAPDAPPRGEQKALEATAAAVPEAKALSLPLAPRKEASRPNRRSGGASGETARKPEPVSH